MVGTLVMAPKSVTFRRHEYLVSVLFGDLLSHSYNITFSMFLCILYCVCLCILHGSVMTVSAGESGDLCTTQRTEGE